MHYNDSLNVEWEITSAQPFTESLTMQIIASRFNVVLAAKPVVFNQTQRDKFVRHRTGYPDGSEKFESPMNVTVLLSGTVFQPLNGIVRLTKNTHSARLREVLLTCPAGIDDNCEVPVQADKTIYAIVTRGYADIEGE